MAQAAEAKAHHTPPAMDYGEHERTYQGFIVGAKWGSIAVCAILVLMAIFLL